MSYTQMAGQIIAAYGQEVESKAAEKAMDYNRRVALRNSQIAEQASEYEAGVAQREGELARRAAEIRADDARRAAERVQHEGRQTASAGGVVSSEGSALLVEMQNVREGEIAAQRELYNGKLQQLQAEEEADRIRYGGRVARIGYENEAKLIKFGMKVEGRTRLFKGFATALGASYSGQGGGAYGGLNSGSAPASSGGYGQFGVDATSGMATFA